MYGRQLPVAKQYACQEFIEGLALLDLATDQIPQCQDVSQQLAKKTGWGVVPVEALIPFSQFYSLLANKKFPAASFIRCPEELDYLQEPDIFHEIFGHCPLLTDPAFAAFSEQFGKIGQITPKPLRARLQRLYWFTVEFGLISSPSGLRAYGGGILSSLGETVYSVESDVPERRLFNILDILRTPYRYDIMQTSYYVIDDFMDFYRCLEDDLLALVKQAEEIGDFSPTFPPIELEKNQWC